MAEAKTKSTKKSVKEFLDQIADERRRKDCKAISKLMTDASGAKPEMWGPSIIGFGRHVVKYAGGREAEWPLIAFSPRKNDLTLYSITSCDGAADLLKKLGKHRTGKGCLYIKRLDEVDLSVLKELIRKSVTRQSSD